MSPRVLIVDDTSSFLELLASELQLHGFEVLTKTGGVSVLATVKSFRPEIVLLDIALTDMNGLELCQILRQHSPVPIILMTGQDSEQTRLRGFDLGADDYITKPFSNRELIARIRALLRRVTLDSQSRTQQPIHIGAIKLNPTSHQVYKGQEEIDLTAREFDLLETLMIYAGQALSHGEILQKVWGIEKIKDFRTLFVHVRWLRQKIEDDPSSPTYIQSIRRFGYRFIDPEEI
jgi:two-component system response regulator RegX3